MTCGRCGKPMLRTVGRIPEGSVRHHGRGYCNPCYHAAFNRPRSSYIKSVRGRSQGRPKQGIDIDDTVVDRLLAGDQTVRFTTSELAAAIQTLSESGRSARIIADRFGITARTVNRHRAKLKQLSVTRHIATGMADEMERHQ